MAIECTVEGLAGFACRMLEGSCFFEEDINTTPPDKVGSLDTKPYEGKCPFYDECMELRRKKMQSSNNP